MLQKQSSVGYLKSTKVNSQAKDKSLQLKDRTKRQYNPDDTNIAKLFLAIREHRTDNSQLNKISEIKELVTQVQNINDRDFNDDGNRPLHVAVSKNHQDIVGLLLNTPGVNPEATNNRDKTPLDIAKSLDNKDIIQQLYRASSLKRENTGENKPEVGSPKKLRISSIKKEEPEGTKIEEGDPRTYPASGLKHTLHGNIYQLKLLMLFLKRGLEKGYSFHLATEWDDAEKFDDLVFIHDDQNGGKSYHFLQAKHKQNEDNKKIGIGDLITEDKNGEFGLAKYFVSYLKIKNNQDFADGVLKDFIICTNIGFDLDQDTAQNAVKKLKMQAKGKNKGKEILVEMIEDNDVFFKDGGERYKLSYDKGNMALVVQQEFKVAVEETITKLETEIKKLQDKSDQDSKNKLKQIQKWEKEFKQIANSGLEDNIKEFFGKLVFAVNQPNEVDLGNALRKEISEEFERKFNYVGDLSESTYNAFQVEVLDWMKHKEGKFFSSEEVKIFFDKFKSEVRTIDEIRQISIKVDQRSMEIHNDIRIIKNYVVKQENNQQAKTFLFDVKDPSRLFVGREKELKSLDERLQNDQHRIVTVSQLSQISGLGGIGKTELARKYIHKYAKDSYENVIWINSENHQTIKGSLCRLAQDKLDLNIKNTDDIKSIVEEVYQYFSKSKSLFIFDNVEKLNDLDQILPFNSVTPSNNKPYILITSCDKGWSKKISTIDLDTLSLDDSINLVKRGLGIGDKLQDDQIGNLVKELQYFPLAIQQAIAHIRETQETYNFEDYLEKYRKKAKELINYKVFEWVSNSYTKTTYTVWEATLDRIVEDKKCGQLALDILNTMAYFAPENIIREMFLSLAGNSQKKLESAINLLINYSMVNGEQKQSLSIHRLVQEVIRLKLQEQGKEEEVLEKALELIKSITIDDENKSHVTSFLDHASKYENLINKFDSTRKNSEYTSLFLLIESDRQKGVKNLIGHVKKKDRLNFLNDQFRIHPLIHAINWSSLQVVKFLIEEGADCNAFGKYGYAPIHLAAIYGDLELAKYLIDKKEVSVNSLSKNKETPLYLASDNDHLDFVKYLLDEKKADPNLKDENGITPLHLVAESGNVELAHYLITQGARVQSLDQSAKMKTFFESVNLYSDMVKRIRQYYLKQQDNDEYFVTLARSLLDSSVKDEALKKLRTDFLDKNTEKLNLSPLHADLMLFDLEKLPSRLQDKELLNARDILGQSPLYYVISKYDLKMVKLFVEAGSDINVRDINGSTPIEYAKQLGKREIFDYLSNLDTTSQCLTSRINNREKREAESKCLFTWEDVDEFNEEKDEKRDLSKIKIDSEKFIGYIKDLPEGKHDQLIQLADVLDTT